MTTTDPAPIVTLLPTISPVLITVPEPTKLFDFIFTFPDKITPGERKTLFSIMQSCSMIQPVLKKHFHQFYIQN